MKKRVLSFLVSMIIFMNLIIPICASAAGEMGNRSSIYYGNGYIVYYNVVDSWSNNSNIEIKIKNVGSEPIANWALKYDAHGEISGIWNAQTYSNDETRYIVKNAGYNYEILPDQTVNFGYCVTGDNLKIPQAFEICSERTAMKSNEYSVSLNVLNDWNDGFIGNITIDNLSSRPIEAWRLNFLSNFTIEDYWNAKLVSVEGNEYCIANDITTTPIGVNESKSFGFRASKSSNSMPEIIDSLLTEISINKNYNTLVDLETNLMITAYAKYNVEEESILIYWNTTVPNGTFTIYESDNNTKYTILAEESGFMYYNYKITEDITKKYFIVRQTTKDGRIAESEPIYIKKVGQGFYVGFPDTDEDGIPDYLEKDIGTDINKADTDGDGLTDYEEFYLTGTDPTVYDSIEENVSDSDADSDRDGLSNKAELDLGTDPLLSDTDNDGLLDGIETEVYGTNPKKRDTDDDGISDKDEIELGLDPLNPETFGVPDSEYIFEETVSSESSNFADINTEENPFEISVKMKAAGNILSNLNARKSVYSKVMTSNATLGLCPEFIYDENCKIDEIVIEFIIAEEYVQETDSKKPLDSAFYGINKYRIFRFFEDTGTLLPIATEVDVDSNTLSTTVDALGSYCVIDMEKFFDEILSYDDDISTINVTTPSPIATFANIGTEKISDSHLEEKDPVNVFYFIDNRDTIGEDAFKSIKESIKAASEIIMEKSEDAHIYILLCTNAKSDDAYSLIEGDDEGDNSFTYIDSLIGELDKIKLRTVNEYTDNCVLSDALDFALKNFNKNRATYCFYAFDQNGVVFRKSPERNNINEAIEVGFNISIISEIDKEYINGYALDLYKETDGIHINKYSDFSNDILMHIYGTIPTIEARKSYNMVTATALKKVKLDAPITEDYQAAALEMWKNPDHTGYTGYADTDGDGLYDFQEIDFISGKIKFVDGELKLPTIRECINEKSGQYYVKAEFDKYIEQRAEELDVDKADVRHKFYDLTYVLPILSDPANDADDEGDTDGDGFADYYEYRCHERRNVNNDESSINYLNGLRFDEWQAKSDVGHLTRTFGFSYDPIQKTLYSDLYPIQRFFGFSRTIDLSADPVLSSAIYCDPIYFYHDGKEYLLELWKGQYGLMTGVEVGLYYRNPSMVHKTIDVPSLLIDIESLIKKHEDDTEELFRLFIGDPIISYVCNLLGIKIGAANLTKLSAIVAEGLEFYGVIDTIDIVSYDDDVEKWYRCVEDQDLISVSYSVEKDGDILFTRDATHWWTTGFEWGEFTDFSNELTVNVTIDFRNKELCDAFIEGGKYPSQLSRMSQVDAARNQRLGFKNSILYSRNSSSYKENEDYMRIDDTKVKIKYTDYIFSSEPSTDNGQAQGDNQKVIIQGNNSEMIEVYLLAKEKAGIGYLKGDVLYTNDPNLITVEQFITAFFESDFFTSDGFTAWLKHSMEMGVLGLTEDNKICFDLNLLFNIVSGSISMGYELDDMVDTYFELFLLTCDLLKSGVSIVTSYLGNLFVDTVKNIDFDKLTNDEIARAAEALINGIFDGLSNIATQKYSCNNNGESRYIYEYYKDWYNGYVYLFDINNENGSSGYRYAINHFFGLARSALFIEHRIELLECS